MYEIRTPCESLKKVEFPEGDCYVLVNKFNEEGYKSFIKDCERVLQTGQKFLPIVIDSYGGEVYSLLGMLDFLTYCENKAEIITVATGKSMSCGAELFSAGKRRFINPTATIMIHDVAGGFHGKNIEFQNDAKEMERLNRLLYSILDKNTEQPKGYWRDLVKNNKYADLFLTATTAKKHNLATEVGYPHIETSVIVTRELVL